MSQDSESTTSEDSSSPQKDVADVDAKKYLITNIDFFKKDTTKEQDDENEDKSNIEKIVDKDDITKAKEQVVGKEDIHWKDKEDSTNKDDSNNDAGNDAVENLDEDDYNDTNDEHSDNEEEEASPLKRIYSRLVIYTYEVYGRVSNQQCSLQNGPEDKYKCMISFDLTCVESQLVSASSNPNFPKVSPFICNICFNIITKQEARNLLLLPITFDKVQKIVDPDLSEKASAYTGYHAEIMLKNLQVVQSPQQKESYNKVTGRNNRNIHVDTDDSDGDNHEDSAPGKITGERLFRYT